TALRVCGCFGENVNWHRGFGAAGVGMTLGLIQYVRGRERLAHVGAAPRHTPEEARSKTVIGILFMAAVSGAVGVLFFGPKSIVDNKVWIMIGALAGFFVWPFF